MQNLMFYEAMQLVTQLISERSRRKTQATLILPAILQGTSSFLVMQKLTPLGECEPPMSTLSPAASPWPPALKGREGESPTPAPVPRIHRVLVYINY